MTAHPPDPIPDEVADDVADTPPDDADRVLERGRPLTPEMLKAMAHPLRLQLLERLEALGPSTASSLGRDVGESSGTTSYHLRRLADVGLIEEAADIGTGRDRYWRSKPGGWSLERDLMDSPHTRVEARMVIEELGRSRHERLMAWQRDQDRWPVEWRDATMISNSRLTLTTAQTAELSQQLQRVIESFRAQQPPAGTAGTARVMVLNDVFPTGPPPESSAG